MTGQRTDSIRLYVEVPGAIYRHLAPIAERNKTTVAASIVELARRQLAGDRLSIVVRPEPGANADEARPKKPRKPARPFTATEIQTIADMHAAGAADYTIARHLGRDHSSVRAHRRSLGLPSLFQGRRRISQEDAR